jgi:glucan endo-1,3-alpha-glucosidase
VVFWYRSHSKNAVASDDPLGPPTDASWADDNVQVIAILNSPATIVINSGGQSDSFAAVAGLNFFTLVGFQEGQQSVEVVRSQVVVMCGVGSILIDNDITLYNFNAAVVQVTPGPC